MQSANDETENERKSNFINSIRKLERDEETIPKLLLKFIKLIIFLNNRHLYVKFWLLLSKSIDENWNLFCSVNRSSQRSLIPFVF